MALKLFKPYSLNRFPTLSSPLQVGILLGCKAFQWLSSHEPEGSSIFKMPETLHTLVDDADMVIVIGDVEDARSEGITTALTSSSKRLAN